MTRPSTGPIRDDRPFPDPTVQSILVLSLSVQQLTAEARALREDVKRTSVRPTAVVIAMLVLLFLEVGFLIFWTVR